MTVSPSATAAEASTVSVGPIRPDLVRQIWRAKAAALAALILLAIVAVAIFAPAIAPTKLGTIDLAHRLQKPLLFGGDWKHPLGTDALGQDELTLLVYGARVSVSTGLIVILLAGSFGTLLGLIAGYFRGWRETVAMRLVEVSIAFPGPLLALAVLTMVGAGQRTLIIILSALSWMIFARVTHDIVLGLRETPFVKAAETVGVSRMRLVFRHLLPNLASALLTVATLEFAAVVLAEASLSYLGFGIQPPSSSWGLMVANGQQYLSAAWWLVAIPGFAIALTVLTLNLLAN
jgi:peptide/nickel transport system permease protein